jgi:hypothetical protein
MSKPVLTSRLFGPGNGNKRNESTFLGPNGTSVARYHSECKKVSIFTAHPFYGPCNGFAPIKGGGGGAVRSVFNSYRSAAQSYSLLGYLQLIMSRQVHKSHLFPIRGSFSISFLFLLAQVLRYRIGF